MDKNKVIEARKYRIYPTEQQQQLINDNIRYNQEMWNLLLNEVYGEIIEKLKNKYETKYNTKLLYNELNHMEYKDKKEMVKRLNKINLKSIYKNIRLENGDTGIYGHTKKQLKQSFDNHFGNPKHFKIPKFKSYKSTLYSGSYTSDAQKKNYMKENNIFKLAKIGNIKLVNHYKSNGRAFKISIKRNSDNEYFIVIFYEQDTHTKVFKKTNNKLGIDFNVDSKTALSFSDGSFVERPKIKKIIKRLDYEQSKLGKKREKLKPVWAKYCNDNKDSAIPFDIFLQNCSNYQKNRLRVTKIYRDIRNKYDYWIKSSCSSIVKNNNYIAIENLQASNMIKNHKLARAIGQSHFRELRTTLEYKALWNDKEVINVDPKYTSQTCSSCGYLLEREERLTLKDREWICPQCHIHHIRDTNAAKNILKKALTSK